MSDKIRRAPDEIDFDDANDLPEEGGGIAEATPESETDELDDED